jgi:hypothetical protein
MFTAHGWSRDPQEFTEPERGSRGPHSRAVLNELQPNSEVSQPFNPYEPSICLPEYQLQPTLLESVQTRCGRYIEETIKHSNNIATSKHVAAFGISQGTFGALAYSLYSHINFSSFSINECPNLMFFFGNSLFITAVFCCRARDSFISSREPMVERTRRGVASSKHTVLVTLAVRLRVSAAALSTELPNKLVGKLTMINRRLPFGLKPRVAIISNC